MKFSFLGRQEKPEVELKTIYDAIVVGSGAAGGMAAHVLTSHGMKVLLLEAGKKLDIDSELKSMEWPYEHPRRGEMPPGHHALSFNEYTIRKPPYAEGASYKHVHSYVQGWRGSDYSKNIVVDEKDHPYSGTNYAWVRARCLGGKTNIWGRLAFGSPITNLRPNRGMATERIGRFPTRTSSPITTGSIDFWEFPAKRKTCLISPT